MPGLIAETRLVNVAFPGLEGLVSLNISFSMRCTAYGTGRDTEGMALQLKLALKERFGGGPGVWVSITPQEIRIGKEVDINLVLFKVVVAGVHEAAVEEWRRSELQGMGGILVNPERSPRPCLVQMDRTQMLVIRAVPLSGAPHSISPAYPTPAHLLRVVQASLGQGAVVHWAGQAMGGVISQRSSPRLDSGSITLPDLDLAQFGPGPRMPDGALVVLADHKTADLGRVTLRMEGSGCVTYLCERWQAWSTISEPGGVQQQQQQQRHRVEEEEQQRQQHRVEQEEQQQQQQQQHMVEQDEEQQQQQHRVEQEEWPSSTGLQALPEGGRGASEGGPDLSALAPPAATLGEGCAPGPGGEPLCPTAEGGGQRRSLRLAAATAAAVTASTTAAATATATASDSRQPDGPSSFSRQLPFHERQYGADMNCLPLALNAAAGYVIVSPGEMRDMGQRFSKASALPLFPENGLMRQLTRVDAEGPPDGSITIGLARAFLYEQRKEQIRLVFSTDTRTGGDLLAPKMGLETRAGYLVLRLGSASVPGHALALVGDRGCYWVVDSNSDSPYPLQREWLRDFGDAQGHGPLLIYEISACPDPSFAALDWIPAPASAPAAPALDSGPVPPPAPAPAPALAPSPTRTISSAPARALIPVATAAASSTAKATGAIYRLDGVPLAALPLRRSEGPPAAGTWLFTRYLAGAAGRGALRHSFYGLVTRVGLGSGHEERVRVVYDDGNFEEQTVEDLQMVHGHRVAASVVPEEARAAVRHHLQEMVDGTRREPDKRYKDGYYRSRGVHLDFRSWSEAVWQRVMLQPVRASPLPASSPPPPPPLQPSTQKIETTQDRR